MSNQILSKNYNLSDAIIKQAEKIKSSSSQGTTSIPVGSGRSFQEILNEKLNSGISFSKHAAMRSEERNIRMSPDELTRLNDACDKAAQKGIRDALIIMDKAAFIVNAPSKLIVTVVDKNEMKNNVFTHIDGAVFL